MNSNNKPAPKFLIDSTCTLGDIVDTYNRFKPIPRNPSFFLNHDRVRTHSLRFHLPEGISTIRIVIVSNLFLNGQENQWRELFPCNRLLGSRTVDVEVTLSLSEDNCKPQPLQLSLIPFHEQMLLRIVHDQVYPVDRETRLVEATFECGDYFCSTPGELGTGGFRRLISTFRIAPLQSGSYRVRTVSLPLSFIRAVGLELTREERKIRLCARQLMTCSLVCKHWYQSDVYNLLWSFGQWGYRLSYENILALAESLEKHPNPARKIHILPRPSDIEPTKKGIDLSRRISAVIVNWTNMELLRHEFHALKNQLVHLARVSYLQVDGSPWCKFHVSDVDGPLELCDLLNTIQSWKVLKELRIRGWAPESRQKLIAQPVCYQLDHLHICAIDDSRRLSLATLQHILARPQSLKTLVIENVTGLSQTDFRTIFTMICSTVESLEVRNCTIDAGYQTKGEELPLDAIVEAMPRLKSAVVSYLLASSLSISRKKTADGLQSGTLGIYWRPLLNDRIEDLEAALRVTGWKAIDIRGGRDKEMREVTNFDNAMKIAKKRGIMFKLKGD